MSYLSGMKHIITLQKGDRKMIIMILVILGLIHIALGLYLLDKR